MRNAELLDELKAIARQDEEVRADMARAEDRVQVRLPALPRPCRSPVSSLSNLCMIVVSFLCHLGLIPI